MQVGGGLSLAILSFQQVSYLSPTWYTSCSHYFQLWKQNREKGKRGKTKRKRKEKVTAKEEEEQSEIEEKSSTKGNLSSILGFVMKLLCKIYMVDVYILFERLCICGWIVDEQLLGFWTWFVEFDHDYGVLVVEKNVYQGFDVIW